jgi:ABC-2 type transport system ATP-binding protein
MAELESRVVEIAGDGLRQVKDRAMKLPNVQSAAQQGLQLRVLMRPDTKDATHYLREHLGGDGLSFAIAKPSLEDVFVASTNGGGRE